MFERPQYVAYTVRVNIPSDGNYKHKLVAFVGNKYEIAEVAGETPTGSVDGVNTTFTLANSPKAGSLYIVADGVVITDDGNGNLSDGGTVDYGAGSFTLNSAPTTSVVVDYCVYEPDGVVVEEENLTSGVKEVKVMFNGVRYEDQFAKHLTEWDKAMLRKKGIFIEPRVSVNY